MTGLGNAKTATFMCTLDGRSRLNINAAQLRIVVGDMTTYCAHCIGSLWRIGGKLHDKGRICSQPSPLTPQPCRQLSQLRVSTLLLPRIAIRVKPVPHPNRHASVTR